MRSSGRNILQLIIGLRGQFLGTLNTLSEHGRSVSRSIEQNVFVLRYHCLQTQ